MFVRFLLQRKSVTSFPFAILRISRNHNGFVIVAEFSFEHHFLLNIHYMAIYFENERELKLLQMGKLLIFMENFL